MTNNNKNLSNNEASNNLIEVSSDASTLNGKSSNKYLWVIIPLEILIVVTVFVAFFVLFVPKIQEMPINVGSYDSNSIPADSASIAKTNKELQKQINKIENKLINKTPKTPYLTISTVKNEYVLYKKQKAIRYGKCSTGSYILLDGGEKQKWIFRTPKGEFRIQNKTTGPVWKKPDWAFVEEGLPIPSPNHNSRFEYGVLGDYALYLGQGYMLHGTLYKRFLGLAVTHGCVRLNDDDLEAIYKTLDIGSKVYIF
jgi:L,D-transpeptidase YbiS